MWPMLPLNKLCRKLTEHVKIILNPKFERKRNLREIFYSTWVWKSKSLSFCLRYDPLIIFLRQNHITFVFIKMMSHDLSANGLFKTQTPKNGTLFKGKTKTDYYFQWQHNIVLTDYLFLSSWVFKLLNFCWYNVCTPSSKVHTENRSHLRRKMTFNCIGIKDKDR